MRLNAKQIAEYTGGTFIVEPLDARALMCGLAWDSREVGKGDLYVALPGEWVDGHDFVAAALAAGALGALVMQPVPEADRVLARELGAALIEVPDTAHAVTDLARAWRTHLHGRVIGLTGSTGKTTTKNLVRDVLAAAHSVVATAGNQNNELGVPKTILSAEPETEAVVVEMGMRGPGQIAELCAFARPDWGIVVNVGESHIELLGSRESIARAKAELLRELPEGTGRAFVNADDDFADFVREDARLDARRVETVLFDGSEGAGARLGGAAGDAPCRPERAAAAPLCHPEPAAAAPLCHPEPAAAAPLCHPERAKRVEGSPAELADGASELAAPAVWAERVELDEQGRPRFELHARGFAGASGEQVAACSLKLRGTHNVANACAAAAVGRAFGMPLAAVADALAHAEPEAGRQEVIAARAGFTVVNDAYNANPDSMRASLTTFCALKVRGRRIAVLGDMGELGDFAPACHAGVGELAATLPLDRLICVGELAQLIADAAEEGGMDPARIVRAQTISDVLGELDTCVGPEDAVLVKASHFMGLERVVEGLVN